MSRALLRWAGLGLIFLSLVLVVTAFGFRGRFSAPNGLSGEMGVSLVYRSAAPERLAAAALLLAAGTGLVLVARPRRMT